tara:strand:- start:2977 stop:3297 length:321 start_codon:yes stop_codon:yes gene_type:complete
MSEAKGRIGFEDFIEAWESSNSVGEACEKLGMEKPNAYARATKYRGEGIPLKKFPGGGGRTAVPREDKLAILAKVRGVAVDTLESDSQALLNRPKRQRSKAVTKME